LQPLDRRTASNGVSYLHRGGEAAPFVFLHGIGSRASSFAPLIEALDPRRAAIAWDAPGYGPSAPLAGDWPLARDYAQALEALLLELEIDGAILAGHSLGTLMAASHARHFGRRLSGVALISPALGFGAPDGGPLPQGARARLDELETLGVAAYAAKRAPQLVHRPQAQSALVEELAETMATLSQPGYGQAVRMLACGRLLEDVAQTRLPFLVICGEEDTVTPPAMARRAEAAIRSARDASDVRLALVPAAGHMVHLEAKEAVASLLRELAATVDTPKVGRPTCDRP